VRDKKPSAPKFIKFFTGLLGCGACRHTWQVIDLNPERKVVQCSVCGTDNKITEAIARG
jgi:hypothetical protein